MAVVAITSAKGSPGVTTTCLALAWVWPVAFPGRQVLVVDADPGGSGIADGYLRGELPDTGIVGLAGLRALAGGDLWSQLIALDHDRWLLLGPIDSAQVAALEPVWQRLANRLAEPLTWDGTTPVDVIVDLGRTPAPDVASPLRDAADVVLVALRSSLTSVASARPVLHRLAGTSRDLRPVLIGDGMPYGRADIARTLRRDLAGPIEFDARTAGVFSDGAPARAGLQRSPLLRSTRRLAESLADVVQTPGRVGEVAAHG